MRAPIATAVAISVAIILLLGSFLPIPLLQDVLQPYLLSCAVIVGGVASLIGIYNLLSVHIKKLGTPQGRQSVQPVPDHRLRGNLCGRVMVHPQ